MVGSQQHLNIAHTTHSNGVFAILGWLSGPDLVQLPFRTRNGTHVFGNQRQRFGLIKFTGNHQNTVIGLVVFTVETLQPVNGYILNVGTGPNRGLAVVMPFISSGLGALHQHTHGAILARFEFVANHGHLRIQVAFGDVGVHHAICF